MIPEFQSIAGWFTFQFRTAASLFKVGFTDFFFHNLPPCLKFYLVFGKYSSFLIIVKSDNLSNPNPGNNGYLSFSQRRISGYLKLIDTESRRKKRWYPIPN
jgi:hypothetical protein